MSEGVKQCCRMRMWVAALLGATAVGMGAFGAHGLKEQLVASGMDDVWQTAALYHLLHAVAVLAWVASGRVCLLPVWLWTMGCVLFSGSLYALSLGGPKLLAYITPIGGLLLIGGWLSVNFSARDKKNPG